MSDAPEETIAVLTSIPGGRALLDWLGTDYGATPPEFGDSQILDITISSRGLSGLTLKMSRYRRNKLPYHDEEGTIRFVFSDIVGLHLSDILVKDGISGPNIIDSLVIRRTQEVPVHRASIGFDYGKPVHEVEIEPCVGAHGYIRATIMRIEMDIQSKTLVEN